MLFAHPATGGRILRRDVYYFHGFDPAPSARYRRIFAASAEPLGVSVDDLPGSDGEGWVARRAGVTTCFRYMRYDDLVRAAQAGGPAGRLGRGLRTLLAYAGGGALWRLPVRTQILMLVPFLVAFAPVVVFAALSDRSMLLAAALTLPVAVLAWMLLFRLKLMFLPDLFACMRTLTQGSGELAEAFAARIADLAGELAEVSGAGPRENTVQETLIVGHSLGGITAIQALAAVLDQAPSEAEFGLLTLGSTLGIVMVQKGPGRDRLAEGIAKICADPRVFWVDISSPRDAFCVPLTDPLTMIDAHSETNLENPRVLSAKLDAAAVIPGDRRKLFGAIRLHMGYLLAPKQEGGFDYADVTTGPETLRDRFGPRGNSPRAHMYGG